MYLEEKNRNTTADAGIYQRHSQKLIAWLETKDPNEHYNYLDGSGNCLYGQFFASQGLVWKDEYGQLGPGAMDARFSGRFRCLNSWTDFLVLGRATHLSSATCLTTSSLICGRPFSVRATTHRLLKAPMGARPSIVGVRSAMRGTT